LSDNTPYSPLTAVILLATDPVPYDRARDALHACQEAGVGFVICPGTELQGDKWASVNTRIDGRDLSRLELP
jgi:hypothetical protein